MNQSPSIELLAKALVGVQKSLKPAPKESENPFFKSKYADLATIIEHSRKALTENGLSISQVCEGDSGVTTILLHESGQWISGTLSIKPSKDDPQGRGSAITYARRYGWSSIIGLATEEDDDANQASEKEVPATKEENHLIDEAMEGIAHAENKEDLQKIHSRFLDLFNKQEFTTPQWTRVRELLNAKAKQLGGKKNG